MRFSYGRVIFIIDPVMNEIKKPTQMCDTLQSHQLIVENKALFSVFQPIYSFSNQACIGMEALLRGCSLQTGFQIPVSKCLQAPCDFDAHEYSQSINLMHLNHWQQLQQGNKWLFLNLDFQEFTRLEDICIGQLLETSGMAGHEIVIEVVESEIYDEDLFEEIIQYLRGYGCLIALDDFGAGHSNIDRIWKAQPDIVKLDRGILLEATKSLRSESILRNLTQLIKEAGSVCLIEGIETREQALLAMDVGADLIQGFYFSKPASQIDSLFNGVASIVDIVEEYPAYLNEKRFVKQIQKKGYETLFEKLADRTGMADVEFEMIRLSKLSFVKRLFILDEQGFQISDDEGMERVGAAKVQKEGKGFCWKNRRYFKGAMHSGEVFVSEPYRSLIDMELCITVSKKLDLDEGVFVACFDVFYHDKSTKTVQISV